MANVIGYTRVSTQEQADSGLGLDAQTETIKRAIEQRGGPWPVNWYEDSGVSGGTPWAERPQLYQVITLLNKEGGTLFVARLDRLSRSLLDFAEIMALSRKHEWALVALDLGVDTTTPVGALVAGIMASFSQFERELIKQRTKEAIAAKKARGEKVGRITNVSHVNLARLREFRKLGWTYKAIADFCNLPTSGFPVPQSHGVKWYPSSVRAVLKAARE